MCFFHVVDMVVTQFTRLDKYRYFFHIPRELYSVPCCDVALLLTNSYSRMMSKNENINKHVRFLGPSNENILGRPNRPYNDVSRPILAQVFLF